MSSATGTTGVIQWGYMDAARVSSWSATVGPGGWSLSATLTDVDSFRVSQRPLTMVVPGRSLKFTLNELQISGTTLTAMASPQE